MYKILENEMNKDMTRLEIEEKVISLIVEQFADIDVKEIKMNSNLVNDLGMDSLDEIECLMGMEDVFNIEISDAEAERIKTVQDCINIVIKKLK